MTSIAELFPKSRKLAYDARQQLSQVQNNILHPSELYLTLEELSTQLNLQEQLLNKETPASREVWRRKLQEIREDASNIKRQGEYYDRMINSNVRVQKDREELLRRRNVKKQHGVNGDMENAMQDLAEESQSLANSHGLVGELLASGQNQLNSLIEQRKRMRGVKRLVLEMGNKIGLSQQTMKMIENRDANDAKIVFAGMGITIVIIYFLWFR